MTPKECPCGIDPERCQYHRPEPTPEPTTPRPDTFWDEWWPDDDDPYIDDSMLW